MKNYWFLYSFIANCILLFCSSVIAKDTIGSNAKSNSPELVIGVELSETEYKPGKKMIGNIVFKNISKQRIKLFYPGLNNIIGRINFHTKVISNIKGKKRFQSESYSIVTSSTILISKTNHYKKIIPGENLKVSSDSKEVVLEPGKNVKFKFEITDSLNILPKYKGKPLSPIGGNYKLEISYQAKGQLYSETDKYWNGKLITNAVIFKMSTIKKNKTK